MERKGVALLSGEHVQNPHSFGHWMCGKPNQEKKIEMFLSIQWRKKMFLSISLSHKLTHSPPNIATTDGG